LLCTRKDFGRGVRDPFPQLGWGTSPEGDLKKRKRGRRGAEKTTERAAHISQHSSALWGGKAAGLRKGEQGENQQMGEIQSKGKTEES